jgi:hypothetical protein
MTLDYLSRIDDANVHNGKQRNTSGGDMASESKCPVTGRTHALTNRDWWPNQLNLRVLHQHSTLSNPMGEAFDYDKECDSLGLSAVIKDLHALMTDSQDWWPADYGHYGGFSFGWRGTAPAPIASATAAARRIRPVALRAAQQLAGQREP